jgi:TolA-binding protein
MRLTAAALLVLLVASASPAAAAANKEHLQLMAEIRMLQEQQQQLQGLLGALQDTLKTFSSKLDDQSAATRKAMADQTLATTNIGDNVRVLREKTDETNVRMSTMAQELESLRQSIASQPAPQAVAPAGPPSDPALTSPVGAAPPASAPPVSTVPPGTSAQRMFETSYDDYSAGRHDMAIQGFQGFVQAFPRHPMAAAALYNIGMSNFSLSKWPEARDSFLRVINEYPTAQGSAVPDAYFKLGSTYERLNQPENAKKAYEAAVQKFPGPPSAMSSQALARLTRR